jgi:hypothetical protein
MDLIKSTATTRRLSALPEKSVKHVSRWGPLMVALVLLLFPAVLEAGGKTTSRDRAQALVMSVRGASDRPARRLALLKLLRALGDVVVTPQGRPLAETSGYRPRGPILLNFELNAIASAPLSARTLSSSDIGGILSAGGLRWKRKPISGKLVDRIASAVISAGQHSARDPRRLSWLIFGELARTRGQPANSPRRWDLVQTTILLSTLADELQRLAHPARVGGHRLQARRTVARPASIGPVANLCKAVGHYWPGHPSLGKPGALRFIAAGYWSWRDYRSVAHTIVTLHGAVASTAVRLAVIDVVHALLLTATVQVDATGDGEQTHFGPAGVAHPDATATPAHPMSFIVKVTSHSGLSKDHVIVNCGPFIGLSLPPDGAVEGVKIDWENGLFADINWLKRHGLVTVNHHTDHQGVARLVYTPHSELVGLGPVLVHTGRLKPAIGLLSHFRNYLARLTDGIGLRTKVFRWRVEWHSDDVVLHYVGRFVESTNQPGPTGAHTTEKDLTVDAVVHPSQFGQGPEGPIVSGLGELGYWGDTQQSVETYTYLTGGDCLSTSVEQLSGTAPGTMRAEVGRNAAEVIEVRASIPSQPTESLHYVGDLTGGECVTLHDEYDETTSDAVQGLRTVNAEKGWSSRYAIDELGAFLLLKGGFERVHSQRFVGHDGTVGYVFAARTLDGTISYGPGTQRVYERVELVDLSR